MDIFAGSLPFKLKEEDLKQLFEQYGEVSSAKIIVDKVTRQNKGFGFIEMPNENEALKAIEALNGFEVLGRAIVVNKSEKKETRGGDSNRNTNRSFNNNNSGGSGYNSGGNSGGGYNKGGNGGGYNKGNGGGGYNKGKSGGFNNNKGGGNNRGSKYDSFGDDHNY